MLSCGETLRVAKWGIQVLGRTCVSHSGTLNSPLPCSPLSILITRVKHFGREMSLHDGDDHISQERDLSYGISVR